MRNSTRYSDTSALSEALEQYLIDNGQYPTGITGTYQELCAQNASDCTGYLDIRNDLVPTYIAAIPQDPEAILPATGYEILINPVNNKVSIRSTQAELDQSVVINPVPLWTPAELSTQLWLDQADASSISQVSHNNTRITQWNDKSGNERHATQVNTGLQPVISGGGVFFDGVDDFLNVDLDFLAGTDHQAYIVDSISNFSNFYGATTGGSSSQSLHVGFQNNSRFRVNFWGNDYNPNIGSEYIFGEQNLLSFQWLTGVGKSVYANGSLQGSNGSAGLINVMRDGGRILCVVGQGCMQANIKEIIFVTDSDITVDTDARLTGYLAHKWSIEDKLPTGHPYKSAPPSNWSPVDITTDLWLDAADVSTFQYNNDSNDNNDSNVYVNEWRDKSGNDRDASQAQTGFYPIYEDNSIYFDGDYLEVDLDFLAGADHSAFIVIRPETPYSNIYGATNPAQGNNSLHVGFRNNSEYRINYWGNDFYEPISPNFIPNEYNVLQFEWIEGVRKSVYINGFLEGTGSGAGTIGTMSGGGRILGVTMPNHDNMTARVQEIIFITDSHMNQTNYDLITGYLAHKWSLEDQLPPTHPYRTDPPIVN